jgi:hypothetical protein
MMDHKIFSRTEGKSERKSRLIKVEVKDLPKKAEEAH